MLTEVKWTTNCRHGQEAEATGQSPLYPGANTGHVSAAVTMVWLLQEGKEAPLLASPWTPGVMASEG